MEQKKLKVAPQQEQTPQIAGFYIPAPIMDQIYGYIGQGPWIEVNDFINRIRNSAQIVYAKNQQNETENQNAPTS